MEGALLLIVIIGLVIINNNINSKFRSLEETIEGLKSSVKLLQYKTAIKTEVSEKKETIIVGDSNLKETIISNPISVKEVISKPLPIIENTSLGVSFSEKQNKKDATKEKVNIPKKSWIEKFKEKNPDIEKFIGENLINKLGILILVLGISFFVKYAIDKDWINEPARVGIGVLCGVLVMAVAHKLNKNYVSFSSVLVAGAISIFYFTIFIAFHEYELFSQTTAFVIMALITAFSALVSVSYNRQELAVLSLIGGFSAPFMLSTGEGNYVVLFSYIAILNIGVLTISYFKKWKIATILAFLFTIILFGGWCVSKIGTLDFSHKGALIFATIFYFIFSVTIVLSNLRSKGVFSTVEYFILVANTFFFFGVGMAILKDVNSNFTGIFTLLLAIYNVFYAGLLYKKFGLDKNAVYLLIGLALTFVTLTIPIQFEGNLITVFWAAEVVLLFWLSKKTKISSFKFGAIILQVLMVISLFMDWKGYYFSEALGVVFNPLFISGVMVSISFYISYWLLKNEKNIINNIFTLEIGFYKKVVIIAAIIITYFTGFLEINYQAFQFLENVESALSFSVTYHFIFISILLYLVYLVKNKSFIKVLLGISILSVIAYISFLYQLPKNEMIENYTKNIDTHYAFYFHYIILGCLVYLGYQLLKNTSSLFDINRKQSKWLPWLFVFAIVFVLSNEIMVHGLHFFDNIDGNELANKFHLEDSNIYSKEFFVKTELNKIQTQIIKIGYPILWGVFAFVFLIIGIKKQIKVLRVIALTLLGVTIVKLFAYDIKNVSETGKIIAFILLGVLILVISFVYQKIKKLVVDEAAENSTEDEKI